MKELRSTIISLTVFLIVLVVYMCADYDKIDRYNEATHSFTWVGKLGNSITYAKKTGSDDQYFIQVYEGEKAGMMDSEGREILPCQYMFAEYIYGEHMAAADMSQWMLFDLNGRQIASFNRVQYPYAYAGDVFFLKYGDDRMEEPEDGVQIIDGVSGKIVAEFDDCYNALRLDDGNWYISKTPDETGIGMRAIPSDSWPLFYEEHYETAYEGGKEPEEVQNVCGFFVNESFEKIFEGKEYRLICHNDGIYVAAAIKDGERQYIAVMDKTGELFRVTDKKTLERIEEYEKSEDLIRESRTVICDEDGNIGFISLSNEEDIIFLDRTGEKVSPEQIEARFYIFSEKNSVNRRVYGLKAQNGKTLIPPAFEEMEFLPETGRLLVNGDSGCGIIRVEVKP